MTDTRYLHAEHCGIYFDMKVEGEILPDLHGNELLNSGKVPTETNCISCGAVAPISVVSRLEHERYTAAEDDCVHCGQVIIFLADKLEWRHHEGEDVDVIEPDYGHRTCSDAMAQVFGLPVGTDMPAYQGCVAEPADTHVTVDLKSGEETTSSQAANQKIIEGRPSAHLVEQAINKLMPNFQKSIGGK